MNHYDVVIVGSGLAGLTLAADLSRKAWRVLLVDRKACVTDSVRTTGIFVRKTLEDFSLPAATLGPPVRRVHLYSPSGRSVSFDSDLDEYRVADMRKLYRSLLADCLSAGVRWMPRTGFESAREVGLGLTRVQLRANGERIECSAGVLVGADGVHSRVARSLDLDINREWIVGVEEVYTVSHSRQPLFSCFLDPDLAPGYLAWVVDDGRHIHVGTAGKGKTFAPLEALRAFKTKLSPDILPPEARFEELRGGRIPTGGVLRRISSPSGLLIGDAAGAVSPLTAGGFDGCIRMSGQAAMAIHAALTTGNREALVEYSGRRLRSRFTTRLAARRLFEACRSRLLLEAGFTLLRVPPVHWLAREIFFGRYSFPDVEMLGEGRRMHRAAGES